MVSGVRFTPNFPFFIKNMQKNRIMHHQHIRKCLFFAYLPFDLVK